MQLEKNRQKCCCLQLSEFNIEGAFEMAKFDAKFIDFLFNISFKHKTKWRLETRAKDAITFLAE